MSKPFFRHITPRGVQKLRDIGVSDVELLALKSLGVMLDLPRMIPLTPEQMDHITNETCIADQDSGYTSNHEAMARAAIEAYLAIVENESKAT